jgi:hypothetical protein
VDGGEILHHRFGWLKPELNNGMFTSYLLVILISLAHPQYHKN